MTHSLFVVVGVLSILCGNSPDMDSAPAYTFSSDVEKALQEFATNKQISEHLQKLLKEISLTGVSCYDWSALKEVLSVKLAQVLDNYNSKNPISDFSIQKSRLIEELQEFEEAPFTLQRFCELLVEPGCSVYKTTKSFIFAVEKLVTVTTTQTKMSPEMYNHTMVEYSKRMNDAKKQEKIGAQDTKPKTASATPPSPTKPQLSRTATPADFTSVDTVMTDSENSASTGSITAEKDSTSDAMDTDK